MRRHHIYLIPGFFGFSNLGGISYFRQVRETLQTFFADRNQPVSIHGVKTLPSASLRQRAYRVLSTVEETGGLDEEASVHFIGHSTGAIDARLVASPHHQLNFGEAKKPLLRNLKTIVSIAGPHYGTPAANFFSTLYGKNLLYFVTLLIIVGLGRRPVNVVAQLVGMMGRVHNLLGLDETLLHQITNQLLREFTPETEAEVRAFLRSILDDQGSIIQLTPEGMDLFNATTANHPGVRYICYATAAPPPTHVIRKLRIRHALTPFNRIIYSLLWTITSRAHPGYPYHTTVESREFITGRPLPFDITERTSDGVVPTLSQIWGEFRGIVRADHHDVIGHYLRSPFESRDGADWFGSGAKFDRETFDRLWEDIGFVLLSSMESKES